ncbi:MAG: AtuA-related protein [Candidatus Dormibacteria bacterium]
MVRVRLASVAQARSGDKGDIANVALFAPTEALYAAFVREVTAERVRAHVGHFVRGRAERHEVPNVRALNFVLHEALDGGASRSLRSDPLGKSFGSLLLRMEVDLTEEELASWTAPAPPPEEGQMRSNTLPRRRSYSTALIWPR